eukprot:gnl/TRDRNA2_/TRDRNA2_189790_c0_seq1.p1 gnl/TRDRNA2_/TRDRNA2_189790_c0~~gnl/TRDRNA2_/TRDRNA2_189790_c0_seq1.p1  ORF type:complete len:317 (+),score=23.33 gnl/TRDRNA2_/TRDRNA2_189790_c0_seq1:106-951(+)
MALVGTGAIDTTVLNSMPDYKEGHDFSIIAREPGAVRRDIPVFSMSPCISVLEQSQEQQASVEIHSVDGVPGAFLAHNVLSSSECDRLVQLTESAGYDHDAPTRLGREVRKNDNCVLIATEADNNAIFERCYSCFPASVSGAEVCGINRRWRFYRYGPGDTFRAHMDPGGWTGSGIDDKGRLLNDAFGDRASQLTFLLYLNDDFDGGSTRFFMQPARPRLGDAGHCKSIVTVQARKGSVLCFFHGNHALSPWHEGEEVRAGTKYVLRSDVLYRYPRIGSRC